MHAIRRERPPPAARRAQARNAVAVMSDLIDSAIPCSSAHTGTESQRLRVGEPQTRVSISAQRYYETCARIRLSRRGSI